MEAIMNFNLADFLDLQSNDEFFFPKNFLPLDTIDIKKYYQLEQEHERNGMRISDTFKELRIRTDNQYYKKVYAAQSSALNFSESSFPSYRFLMSEVLIEDWLATIDFHKKYSRDHALHQPLTSYIVFRLLGGGNSKKSLLINGKRLLDICVEKVLESNETKYLRDYLQNLGANEVLFDKDSLISKAVWKDLFFETAMVSAIFHDIGYPWQYINRLSASIKACDFNLKQFSSNTNYIRETFKNRLVMYPFYGYKSPIYNTPCDWNDKLLSLLSDSLSKTHGFPGALGYLYLNDIIRKYPSNQNLSLNNFCIEWAALGIMMHDMKGIYWGKNNSKPENDCLRLSFDNDPLSCIVALADVIEEFERPMANFTNKESDCSIKYEISCLSTSLSEKGGTLNICYKYNDERERIKNIEFKAKDEKDYFDPQYGYMDLSSIGIKKVHLLCINDKNANLPLPT